MNARTRVLETINLMMPCIYFLLCVKSEDAMLKVLEKLLKILSTCYP